MAGAMWAVTSIGMSAGLYLLGFGTTMSTLRSYYRYQYECPHAPLSSPLLRQRICRAVRSSHRLHSFATEFWVSVSVLAMAHLAYPFIFWRSLDPHHHPLRMAYFMPLIHLYRLLKLLYHTFSCQGIKKIQEGQRECISLYNALGAALETTPQFYTQFHIVMKLGEYVNGSSDPNMHAQRIPTNLLLSLMVSLTSGVYNSSMGVILLMEEHMKLARKVCLCMVVGCQALLVMIINAILYSALAQISDPGIPITLFIYLFIEVLIAWAFCGFLLKTHCDYHQSKKKLLRIVHSFGLGLMTSRIGPIYVIVKLKAKPSLLIWGILSHIFAQVIGFALVFLRLGNTKEGEEPCHSLKITPLEAQRNHYLTCQLFLGTMIPSLFLLIVIVMLFIMFLVNGEHMPRVASRTSMGIVCKHKNKPSSFTLSTSRIGIKSPKYLKANQQRIFNNFKLLLLFFSINLIIQNHQKHLHKRLVQAPPDASKEIFAS